METTSTRKSDSPQEFVRSGILCGFPGYLNSNIFGVDHGHAPRFQYEIARVLIYAAAVDQHTDVIVDSFFACPVLTCPPIVPLPAAGKKQESHLCGLWSGGAPTLVRLLPLRNRFPWPDGIAASPIPVSFFACVFSRFDSRRSIRHRLQKARKENKENCHEKTLDQLGCCGADGVDHRSLVRFAEGGLLQWRRLLWRRLLLFAPQ